MTTTIAKEFRWEMGHRLPFHTGLCKNIHGHSYKLRVELEGELDENGMVMDFYDITTIVQPIIDRLDHAFMCDEQDAVMIEFFLTNPMKTEVVPFVTTAENISNWLLQEIEETLKHNTRIHRICVRLHETERSYAERSVVLK